MHSRRRPLHAVVCRLSVRLSVCLRVSLYVCSAGSGANIRRRLCQRNGDRRPDSTSAMFHHLSRQIQGGPILRPRCSVINAVRGAQK